MHSWEEINFLPAMFLKEEGISGYFSDYSSDLFDLSRKELAAPSLKL